MGSSPWGRKESDMTEWLILLLHFSQFSKLKTHPSKHLENLKIF